MSDQDLRKAGLKVTLPRVQILELLEAASERHLSADDVYNTLHEAGSDVSLATVYRVLTQFETAGLVIRHNFEGGHAVYELDHGQHHDHMVCVQCGSVEEFVDEVIEERQQSIAEKAAFTITDHSLTIYGLCHQCSAD